MGQPLYDQIDVPFSETRRSRDSSALLGDRLLQGWRMLAECCPDCAVSLTKCDLKYLIDLKSFPSPKVDVMVYGSRISRQFLFWRMNVIAAVHRPPSSSPLNSRRSLDRQSPEELTESPSANGIASLSGNTSVAPAANAMATFSTMVSAVGAQLPPYPSSSTAVNVRDPDTAEDNTQDMDASDYARFRQVELDLLARRDANISNIAEEMPVTPGQQPERDLDLEVATYNRQTVASQTSPVQNAKLAESPKPCSSNFKALESQAGSAHGRKEAADASADIAEKMLQGWTLLAQHCPRCLNPLLANQSSQMFCSGCKMWALPEKSQELPSASSSILPRQPHPSPQKLPETATWDGGALEAGRKPGGGYLTFTEVARSASQTVLSKMAEADRILAAADIQDLEKCRQLVAILGECGRSLKALGFQ